MAQRSSSHRPQTQRNKPRIKSCDFCANGVKAIDYKNVQALTRYTSSYSKILPRRKSGVCSKHQRKLAMAIKRARFMALMPYTPRA
ncbi:MAG: 30S ribosomal protein S18 [Candidatus Komeilibacteria bacterium RIFCSPLOWO2_01_FULL_52_15]|uniref:Small ribosomal subunit protein bS18 n=2 Tax=Candidatus Komeiliibacteriota TaxID=1817908 RepID=A0A1G2BS39_9BACT|nr:MAG: 30S ribosomal protein S18 [Candidatus Komeilibacteria bacterium RIFCSPHIGHO2_01_FULL_52_14]OGY91868.1 MAG: 30S ribosomal protein S18 [Candidatus Komeilibacteria bacterium RIFCSPLOWO2_01_FULL_52_15]